MLSPRSDTDRAEWNDFFMVTAVAAAQRSPDPNTQVGAVIVDRQNRIISTGYNGFPRGIPANYLPWDRKADKPEDTKYPYVVHAEMNAILNCVHRPEKCVLYTTLHPCNECAKAIIQSGIDEVWYLDVHPQDSWQFSTSKDLLSKANVLLSQCKKEPVSLLAGKIHDILKE